MEGSIWVSGVPATFATNGERAWKNCIFDAMTVTPHTKVDYTGLKLSFTLPTLAPKGHPLDVDNLCEPVFSVLIGKLGWFQGRRQNLKSWHATKVKGDPYGVQISNWCIDKNGKCYLVRNKTKIHFGREQNLICTVIMTNPGSFGPKSVRGWDDFQYGKGDSSLLQGSGYPDPTMRNIIWAIQSAYELAQKGLPTGYIDVFNLSSVVCPKGENASNYHEYVSHALRATNISEDILVGKNISTEDGIRSLFEKSPFVITGFLHDTFKDKVYDLLSWSNRYSWKTALALDNQSWPAHPIRWRREADLGKKAIMSIEDVIVHSNRI